jgi:predicted nucleic acid-binding protein
MNYVVDASVAIKWYVPEILEHEASNFLREKHDLHVPELILPEFSSIVWKKVKRGQMLEEDAKRIVTAISIRKWRIHLHGQIMVSAYEGAKMTGQTVYDWVYLALAISLDCELITADGKFYNALENTPFKSNLKWVGDFKET